MKYLGEKEAEDFLEKEKFDVVDRAFVKNKRELAKMVSFVGFPLVMKVVSPLIVHKAKEGGVKRGIKTYTDALRFLMHFKKMKGFKGVMLQRQISGNEFLLGLKNTPEFGHVLVFGAGGSQVEEKKDVAFRVVPLSREDAREMMGEVKASRRIMMKDRLVIEENILRLSKLSEKHEDIEELDINPLMVEFGKGIVVDARIVF